MLLGESTHQGKNSLHFPGPVGTKKDKEHEKQQAGDALIHRHCLVAQTMGS